MDKEKGEFIYIDNVEDVFTEDINDEYHVGVKVNRVYFTEKHYYPVKRYTLMSVMCK